MPAGFALMPMMKEAFCVLPNVLPKGRTIRFNFQSCAQPPGAGVGAPAAIAGSSGAAAATDRKHGARKFQRSFIKSLPH